MGEHGEHGALVGARVLRLAAVLGALAGPVAAQGHCRLALLLALDVSSSVDDREYVLQRDGVAAALLSPDIVDALLAPGGNVALGVYEWSGRFRDRILQDWVIVRSRDDIVGVAQALSGVTRVRSRYPTSLGYALGFGATMMRDGPDCDRRVIDVSGDGVTNDGFWPSLAYKHFPFDGVTVNGLAVLGADLHVQDHYEDEVARGPGSFVETALGYNGFQRAMERKLYREINNRIVGGGQSATEPPG